MRKFFRKVHIWLSIPVGLIICLICLTGAILVFETELKELLNHNHYFVKETGEKPLPIDEIITRINSQLDEGKKVSSIQVQSDPKRTYQVGISGQFRMPVYVNPYTAEIVGSSTEQSTFFADVRRLHRWLMLQGDSRAIGKNIVGITTLIMVIILISGLIIWVPKSKKQLKINSRIRIHSGWKKFWYDLHCAGGFYTTIILLVLALTGLTWSFDWYRNGFYSLFGVELPQRPAGSNPHQNQRQGQGQGRGEGREERPVNYANWTKALEEIQSRSPKYKAITVQDGSASVTTPKIIGNRRGSDRYSFDKRSGEITEVQLYTNQEKSGKMRGWIYSVHVGSWGGWITKIITVIVALFGASLPITGYYFYIKKLLRKKHRNN